MDRTGLELIQKCSTEHGHLTFLYMAGLCQESARRKRLIDAMLDHGVEVRQVMPLRRRERKRIYLVAPVKFDFDAYFKRLMEIFEGALEVTDEIRFVDAFSNSAGSSTDSQTAVTVTVWCDLEYGVFITFKKRYSLHIRSYLDSIQAQPV